MIETFNFSTWTKLLYEEIFIYHHIISKSHRKWQHILKWQFVNFKILQVNAGPQSNLDKADVFSVEERIADNGLKGI